MVKSKTKANTNYPTPPTGAPGGDNSALINMPSTPSNIPEDKTDDEIIAECEQLILNLQNEAVDLRKLYDVAMKRLTQQCNNKPDLLNDPLNLQAKNILLTCQQTQKKLIMTDYDDHQFLAEILLRTQIGLIRPEKQDNLNKLIAAVNKVDGNRSYDKIIGGAVFIFLGLALIATTYALAVGTFGVAPLLGLSAIAIIGKIFGYGFGGVVVGIGISSISEGHQNKKEYGLIQSCSLFKNHAQTKALTDRDCVITARKNNL